MQTTEKAVILLIDDDQQLRMTLSDILKVKGYDVITARYGAEGIAAAKLGRINIALVDLLLPDLSGLEVLAEIKGNCPSVEVIILTGHATLDSAIEATNKGAFSYLQKPYEIEQLLLHIRRAMEKQRAEKEILKLASFPRLIPNPVIELTLSGEITYLNPEAENLFPEILSGGASHPMISNVVELSGGLYRGEQKEIVREVSVGDCVYEEYISYVPEGNLIRIYALNITERKKAQKELTMHRDHLQDLVKERTKELEDARVLAEAANMAKSEFLSNMSHELRSPLNSVIGFSELLAEGIPGPLNEKQKEYLDDIIDSGRHLLSLITDILELSKIEIGDARVQISPFNFHDFLDKIIAFFRMKAVSHDIKTEVTVSDDIPEIESDYKKLGMVLQSLLSNAFKFSPDGGTITVAATRISREDRECVEISVADTGIGISEEDQKKIFQPFSQLEPALSKKYAGAGLGLYLSKKYTELLGGSISVTSEKGKGSTFTVLLPLKTGPGS